MEIYMVEAEINVGTAPNGDKAIIAVDPSGIRVVLPMSDDGARAVAKALTGGITVVPKLELPRG